ncbi:MAG: GH116 family glycosyl hydrolase [Thermoproteota archaeon]
MKTKFSYSNLSGIPLGGIGTGSIEVRGDGCFYEWHVFNNGACALRNTDKELEYMDENDFFIAVRVKPKDGEPVIRLLGAYAGENKYDRGFAALHTPLVYGPGGNTYTIPWVRPVDSIEFNGEPPIASLRYEDKDLPLIIEVEILSPFIPGDIKNSALPAFLMRVRLLNKSEAELEVSVVLGLKNPMAFKISNAKAISKVIEVKDVGLALNYSGEEIPPTHSLHGGSMTLLAVGPKSELSARVGVPKSSDQLARLWVDVRREGAVNGLQESFDSGEVYGIVCRRLSVVKEAEAMFILSWFFPGFYDSFDEKIGHAYENWFKNSLEVAEYVSRETRYLYDYTKLFHDLLYSTSIDGWLIDLIASQITTLVKSTYYTRDMVFGIWEGYGCCGLNTLDVGFYGSLMILQLFPELEKNWLTHHADWQLKPGLFPYYELYALAYPENMILFKEEVMKDFSIVTVRDKFVETISRIVAKTGKDPRGRMPHLFTGSFKTPDAYHMVDLMPKFVLIAFRDAVWTGDMNLLGKLWSSMKDAIECVLRDDATGLRLPYHTTPSGFESFGAVQEMLGRIPEMFRGLGLSLLQGYTFIPLGFQSFDAWSFLGVSAYAGVTWITALASMENAAILMGEKDYGNKLEKIRKETFENLVKLLWNGEYFYLWSDPVSGMSDKACMSAQLASLLYSYSSGIPVPISSEMVRKTLRSVFNNCFKRGEGLINGTYPGGKRPAIHGDLKYENDTGLPYRVGCQMDTPWTGVELAVAAQMIREDMLSEATAILGELYERYSRYGMFWNHVECGGHYYRSMASWEVFIALEGLLYNGFDLKLVFKPKVSKKCFKGLFTIAGSWGEIMQSFESNCQKLKVKPIKNTLKIRRVALEKLGNSISSVEAHLDGSNVNCEYLLRGDEIEIIFEKDVSLTEEKILSINIHYEG